MTIDEVITNAREEAEKNRKEAYYSDIPWHANDCKKWAEENEQIAAWLEDYKKLKSIDEDLRLKYCYEDLSDADNWGYLRGYNEAIDDFTKKIVGYGTYDDYGNVVDVLEIANELKGCAE